MNKVKNINFYILSFLIVLTVLLLVNFGNDASKYTKANPGTGAEWVGLLAVLILFFLLYAMVFWIWSLLLLIKKIYTGQQQQVITYAGTVPSFMVAIFLLVISPSPFKNYRPQENYDEYKNGTYKFYSEDSTVIFHEVTYKDNEKDGLEIERYDNGKIMFIGYFINGRKDSLHMNFNRNGDTIRREIYKNGFSFHTVTWYENGNKSFESYSDSSGLKIIHREWWENGHIRLEANLGGSINFWEENGEQTCKKGTGVVNHYRNGVKSNESIFQNNKLIKQTHWDENSDKAREELYLELSGEESAELGFNECPFMGHKYTDWYSDGKVKRIFYSHNNMNCTMRPVIFEWDKDGNRIK